MFDGTGVADGGDAVIVTVGVRVESAAARLVAGEEVGGDCPVGIPAISGKAGVQAERHRVHKIRKIVFDILLNGISWAHLLHKIVALAILWVNQKKIGIIVKR